MKNNTGLKNFQAEKRKATEAQLKNALKAIKQLEGSSSKITAKKILDNSNLSRSVLYKNELLKIWNEELYEIRTIRSSSIQNKLKANINKQEKNHKKQIETMANENAKLQSKINQLQTNLENQELRLKVKELDIAEKEEHNKKLLAECQRLNNLLSIHGIEGD